MCQHPACAAETRTRSKDCDVTIEDRMGSRDALPIPFPSFTEVFRLVVQRFWNPVPHMRNITCRFLNIDRET